MPAVSGPAPCAACGRTLPAQRQKGRRRRYCDATCRSAARRQREADDRVKTDLTPDDASPDRTDAAPLAAVGGARELSAAANAALQEAVDRARAAGHSWREIGDVLHTSRQAAFQRFGRPVDPRTGQPMARDLLPGAAHQAAAIVSLLAESRWDDICAGFSPAMRARVDPADIARGWAQTVGLVGQLERVGEPVSYPAGDVTVVDVPLYFEAGERTGRVSFGRDGKIAGLFIRPAPS